MAILKKVCCRYTLTILLVTAASDIMHAAPITFNSALPISQGERILRGLITVDHRSSSSANANIERNQVRLTSVFGYGINANWSIFGALPVSHNSIEIDQQTRDDQAIEEAEIFSRYEVLQLDKLGTSYRLAPFAGVRFPTAAQKQKESDANTIDTFAGLIFSAANIEQNFDLQFRYDRNGSDTLLDQGDIINVDFSWQRRVAPKQITSSTNGFWFVALESNLNRKQRNRLSGLRDNNSGGFTASIAPGVQYVTRRWIAEFAVRIPVVQRLNGNALETDYTVFTGIRANF